MRSHPLMHFDAKGDNVANSHIVSISCACAFDDGSLSLARFSRYCHRLLALHLVSVFIQVLFYFFWLIFFVCLSFGNGFLVFFFFFSRIE